MRLTFDPLVPPECVGLNNEEPENFGVLHSGIGYDLRGASRVCFDVRSLSPSLKVQFSVAQKSRPFYSLPQTWTPMCLDFASLGVTANDLTEVHYLFTIGSDYVNAPNGGTLLLANLAARAPGPGLPGVTAACR